MRAVHLFTALLLVAAAACSADTPPNPPATTLTTTAGPGESPATGGSGAVPDACGLITSAELSQFLGMSVTGDGNSQSVGPDRSICIYDGGVITAVELASNYEPSRSRIEAEGRTTTDVPGVGAKAFYDEAGQLVASGDQVFVAITASGVPVEMMVEAAKVMLENAGEAP